MDATVRNTNQPRRQVMKLSEIQTLIASNPDTLFNTKDGLVKVASITDQRLGYSLGMVSAPWVIRVSSVQYIRAKDGKPSHCLCFNTRIVTSRALQSALTINGDAPATIKDWTEHMDNVSTRIDQYLERKYA